MRAACLVVITIAIALGGCGDRHSSRHIKSAELVGTWRLTKESLQLFVNDGFVPAPGQTYTITFNDDGSLAFASLDEWVSGPSYVTSAGVWRLHQNRNFAGTVVPNVLEIELRSGDNVRMFSLATTEESGALRLWTYHSDPDLREFIEYERVTK